MGRVLIIGQDGRAKAMVKHFHKEKNYDVWVSPGTPDMPILYPGTNCMPASMTEDSMVGVATRLQPHFVIVTGIDASEANVVDGLRERGFKVFGVGRTQARLELDRDFANLTCQRAGIATPAWASVKTASEAIAYVEKRRLPQVIKAGSIYDNDVFVCDSVEETLAMLEWLGDTPMILEDRIHGIEVSYTAFVHGKHITPVATVFEHKRLVTGDMGCMTGEMGSFIAAGFGRKGEEVFAKLAPVLEEMDYRGILDINCIYDTHKNELYFVEFTCRWGDPTTEILLEMLYAVPTMLVSWVDGGARLRPVAKHAYATGVVLALSGFPYPDMCRQGMPIRVLPNTFQNHGFVPMNMSVDENGKLVTKGGRQAIVVGVADRVKDAIQLAYNRTLHVHFFEQIYRTDIGAQVKRQRKYLRQEGIMV